jgi:hypothetical protein
MMMMMMKLKMLVISVRMLLVGLVVSVKVFDLLLNLQNDEILMQRSTSHVPNQAIRMNTFHQHPKRRINQKEDYFFCLRTNIDTIPTLLAILKAISKRVF